MDDTKTIKAELRNRLRKARREHAQNLPPEVGSLIFSRPPGPVLDLVPDTLCATGFDDAQGRYRLVTVRSNDQFNTTIYTIALPWLVNLQTPMIFRVHSDPYAESDLAKGYFGLMQGSEEAPVVTPDVLFMPLVAFTANGDRLGQGGGFYDKWLGAHPDIIRIGLAWDMQEVPELPIEPHDMGLTAVVTPTRVIGPF